MNQEGETKQPAVRRAEEVLGRAGQNVGFFAVRTGQRLQHTVPSLRKDLGQEGAPAPSPEEQAKKIDQPMMTRAEEMVDRVGGTLGLLSSVAGIRIRRATARMREQAEDLLAEAQSIRHRGQAPTEEDEKTREGS